MFKDDRIIRQQMSALLQAVCIMRREEGRGHPGQFWEASNTGATVTAQICWIRLCD